MSTVEDDTDETRLPGTPLIGHANGWLFKLNYDNLNVYPPLFKVLRRYNLSPRQFSERNIIDLINLKGTENKRLKSIRLLSNETWVRQHQDIVDNFRRCRWPSYPFETKFEIMKLISKHIITFHDLIVFFERKTLILFFQIKLLNKLLVGSQLLVTMMTKIGTKRTSKKNNKKNQMTMSCQYSSNIFL
jgi:hypothetical protein